MYEMHAEIDTPSDDTVLWRYMDLEKLIGKRPFKADPGALEDGVPEPKKKQEEPSTSSGRDKAKAPKQSNDSDEESKPST